MTRASDTAKLLGAGATILDGTTISTADNTDTLTLKSTDADANTGPTLFMQRDSASPADGDSIGKISFVADNDAGEATRYARIDNGISDASNGTEDAFMFITTMVGGAELSRITLQPTETILNEESADLDFRVEGNGDTHALFVQGSDDKVGINNSSPVEMLTIGTTSDTATRIQFLSATNGANTIHFGDGTSADAYRGYINYAHDSDSLQFASSGSESMRVHGNGALSINTTSDSVGGLTAAKLVVETDTGNKNSFAIGNNRENHAAVLVQADNNTGIRYGMYIVNASGGEVGKISYTSSATTFATSSDYRLKENVNYDFDATSRLKQLKPARFNFKIDADNTVDGFLAHEVSSIVPEAIVGEKDAMFEEVLYVDSDEIPDGKKVGDVKTASKIAPQSIDQSKLVPLLVKTIQELEARITALESA